MLFHYTVENYMRTRRMTKMLTNDLNFENVDPGGIFPEFSEGTQLDYFRRS